MDNEYFAPINTVSQELGIPAYTLRYWEKQFPTVVRPVAGAGGRRYYRAEMVARLRTIQDLLYNRGMTIAGVKKLIRSGEFSETVARAQKPISIKPADIEPRPTATPIYDTFKPERPTGVAAIDRAKIDSAVGLLKQARELLN